MNKNKMSEFKSTVKLHDLVSVFVGRKWLFIGFFVVILIIGLLFTFLKAPVYQSTSTLKLKDVYYEENLYKYFPEEARNLGIFAPGMVVEELESEILTGITEDIRSDILLDEVSGKLDFEINKEELDQVTNTLIDKGDKVVRVIATYITAEGAYQTNETLINTYLESRTEEKSEIIDDIITEIDNRIAALQEQYGDIESQNESADGTNGELDSINNLIVDLNEIKYNLENNKEIYINNIEISEEPSIPAEAVNADNFKSILVTVFAAIAVGLIAVYIPSVFIPIKR